MPIHPIVRLARSFSISSESGILLVIRLMGLCCSIGSELNFSTRPASLRKRTLPLAAMSFAEPKYHELDTPRFRSRRSTLRYETEDLSDLLWVGDETPKFGDGEVQFLNHFLSDSQLDDHPGRKMSWAEETTESTVPS